jgi:small subunit ribosomal protein S27Ae
MAKAKKKRRVRERKEKVPKRKSTKWKAYDVSGDSVSRKLSSCPKCGDGVYLAKHKDRMSCGKCGYTESSEKEEAGK